MQFPRDFKKIEKLSPAFGALKHFPGFWMNCYNNAVNMYIHDWFSQEERLGAPDAMVISARGLIWSLEQHQEHTQSVVEQTKAERERKKSEGGPYYIDPVKLYGAEINIPHWAHRVGAIPTLAAMRDLGEIRMIDAFWRGTYEENERAVFLLATLKHFAPKVQALPEVKTLRNILHQNTRKDDAAIDAWVESCKGKFAKIKGGAIGPNSVFAKNLQKSADGYVKGLRFTFNGSARPDPQDCFEYVERRTQRVGNGLIWKIIVGDKSPLFSA